MELNKMGVHVKRGINGFLNKLFGKITKSEVRLHNGTPPGENFHLDNTAEITLLKADVMKSQAFALVRKLQNR